MKQYEVEVVGYTDDEHENIMYRADLIIMSNDIKKSVVQEVSMIYNNPNAVIVAVINLEEARNRRCTFHKGDCDE